MTLTPIFLTGWEHGVAALDSALGGGLCSAFTGTPTSDTVAKRAGTYGLLLDPSGAAGEAIRYNTTTTGIRKVSARVYVRFVSLPTTDVDLVSFNDVTPTQIAWVDFRQSDSRIIIQMNGGTATAIGPNPVVTGVWYRIDVQCDSSTTTGVIRGMVDGGTEGTASLAGFTAKDQRQWHLGNVAACTMTLHMDDFIFGTYTVDSEYWGPGQCVWLPPNAEGTHSNAANVIEDQAGNDIDGTTFTAFDKINSVPIGNGTTRLQSNGIGAANYVEVQFPDLSGVATAVNGARAMLALTSASAAANVAETRVRRGDGTPADVIGVGSITTTTDINQRNNVATGWSFGVSATIWYKGCMIPATANGTDYGSLTVAIVNALRARFGYASDATPDPWWIDFGIEVDYRAPSVGRALVTNQAVNRAATY